MNTITLYEWLDTVVADRVIDNLEKELAEMFTSAPTRYDEYWNIDKKLLREEKVKKAQSYKRKNQDHPAFRK